MSYSKIEKCGHWNKSRKSQIKQDKEESINISDNVSINHLYCYFYCKYLRLETIRKESFIEVLKLLMHLMPLCLRLSEQCFNNYGIREEKINDIYRRFSICNCHI